MIKIFILNILDRTIIEKKQQWIFKIIYLKANFQLVIFYRITIFEHKIENR